jgi:ParB family chromosome partitioning protein
MSSAKKVLGRGLGAYFNNISEGTAAENGIVPVVASAVPTETVKTNILAEIQVSSIRANPFQPRKEFDELKLQELSDSIRQHGLIQPITVRHIGERRYELISGERRLRASRMAGLEVIPAYVREVNDEQSLLFAIIENIQREELNAIEVALGYKRLIEECNLTQEQVADRVGKSRPAVTNFLRLLQLPPAIQSALKQGKISNGHARSLITIEDPKLQELLLRKTIEEDFSVRQLEDAVRNLNESKRKKAPQTAAKQQYDIHMKSLTDRLTRRFSTRVDIKKKAQGGEIRIAYYTDEDLDRILTLFDDHLPV